MIMAKVYVMTDTILGIRPLVSLFDQCMSEGLHCEKADTAGPVCCNKPGVEEVMVRCGGAATAEPV